MERLAGSESWLRLALALSVFRAVETPIGVACPHPALQLWEV